MNDHDDRQRMLDNQKRVQMNRGRDYAEAAAGLLINAEEYDSQSVAKAQAYAILALAYATADNWQ
jgi:hypothetical protein